MKLTLNLNGEKIFFASDYHFYHGNVIKYDGRPFDNVREMNETLIENWNNKIGKDDTVFYLGDFSFKNGSPASEIAHELNGKIHFILGNHDDHRDIKSFGRFETISDYIHLNVADADANRGQQCITMSHFPMLSWDKINHGSIMLHGHEHGSMMKNPNYDWYYKRKVLDVGCNMHNYSPISFLEVKSYMKDKLIEKTHH